MNQVSLTIDTVNHVLNFARSTGLPMGALLADRILTEVSAPILEAQKKQEIEQAITQAREAWEKAQNPAEVVAEAGAVPD
ncbi:MAG TPA: hypothetical protein VGJ20_35915, partial [Xanthobacteraceae bacterium]